MSAGGQRGDDARAELRDQTIAGVAAVAVRGVVAKVMGFAASVILARLLAPEDFGVLAVGLAIVAAGSLIADAGLAAGLVRREQDPTTAELRAMLGIQVVTAVAAALVALGVGFAFGGQAGRVAGVMSLALPAIAVRGPVVAVLERALDYGPIVAAEMLESAAFLVLAVAFALAGLGVWGVAAAAVLRSIIGTVVLVGRARQPLRPSLAWGEVKELIPFGLRYQGVAAVNMARDQAVNFGTLAIAGLTVLGHWTVAYRLLSVLFILFGSLWRVSYPATARLLAVEGDPAPTLAGVLGGIASSTALVTVPLAAAASLGVPLVLGEQWRPVVEVIPIAALGLTIAGPVSVSAAGYLYAIGRADIVLRSSILHTIGWLVVALPLLPSQGVGALGLGWFVASAIEAIVLGSALQRTTGVRVVDVLAKPLGAAVLVGWLWLAVASRVGGWPGLALVGVGSMTTYVALHAVLDREGTRWVLRLIRRVAGSSTARRA